MDVYLRIGCVFVLLIMAFIVVESFKILRNNNEADNEDTESK